MVNTKDGLFLVIMRMLSGLSRLGGSGSSSAACHVSDAGCSELALCEADRGVSTLILYFVVHSAWQQIRF